MKNEVKTIKRTFEKGKELLSGGKINDARYLFYLILNYYPDNNEVLLEMGRLEALACNIENARKCFKMLIETDFKNGALLELGRLEASINNIDEAMNYFIMLLNTGSKYQAQIEIIFCYITSGLYAEAYDFLKTCDYQQLKFLNCKLYETYLKVEKFLMNVLETKKERTKLNYKYSQILNYNRDRALEHILKHLKPNLDKHTHSVFSGDIDIEGLFDKIRFDSRYLVSRDKVDNYLIPYENSGITKDGEITDYIMVITILGTNQVLTMYPYKEEEQVYSIKR